jgi:putative acetyltransferase
MPAVILVIKEVYDDYGFPWEPEGYHRDLYDIEGYYDRQGDQFFLAEIDGQPVGTVAVEFFDPILAPDGAATFEKDGYVRVAGTDCSLERLYVVKGARNAGVGTALVKLAMEIARADGRTNMELWSDKKLVEAHRLYKRLGARVVGERICDDPDLSPEWGLLLPLQP